MYATMSAVRLSLGERRWSGVLIDPRGYILTTSSNMGQSPLVDYETDGGQSGQAWTIGRNDTWDLALLEVISGQAGFDLSDRFGSTTPGIGDDVLVFGYPATEGSALDQRQANVLGGESDLNTGINYFQIPVPIPAGVEGGSIFSRNGQLLGIRMSDRFMEEIGIGSTGESFGVGIDSLQTLVLPQLLGGLVNLGPPPALGNDAAPPPLPTIFSGTVRVDTGIAQAGQFPVYARISKPGQPDIWVRADIGANGRYHLLVSATSTYNNASIEFWGNRVKSTQTQTFTTGFKQISYDLTFPR